MPLPVIPNTYRVALHWESPSALQTAENVIHLENVTAGDAAADVFTDLVNALDAGTPSHVTHMFLTASNQAKLVSCTIQKLDGTSAAHLFPFDPIYSGQASAEWSPATACVVTHYTPVRGRSGRGRTYVPFTGEDVMVDGILGGGDLSGMQNGWDAFAASLTPAAPTTFVVASYSTSSIGNVDRSVVRVVAATQRRRQSRLRH